MNIYFFGSCEGNIWILNQEEAIFTQTCINTDNKWRKWVNSENVPLDWAEQQKLLWSNESRPHLYCAVPSSDHQVSDFPLCATDSLQEKKKKSRKYELPNRFPLEE